jgi:arabinofuranosyltransferase
VSDRIEKLGPSEREQMREFGLRKQGTVAAESRAQALRVPWAHVLVVAGAVVVAFALYVGVELRRNGVLGFPLDDPWIHLKFAQSLARGWGFAFNRGEPVAGSSAPVWTLILAFFQLFQPSAAGMVWIAKLLGSGFLLLAGVFAGRTLLLLTQNKWAGLAAGVVLVLLSPLDWAMVSGMEVTLAVFLCLASIYYFLRAAWPEERPSSIVAGLRPWILFALAVYARPEAFCLAGLAIVDMIVRRLAFRQKTLFWRGLAVYLVLLVPYFVLNLSLAHSLFPQTYVAKVGRTSLFAALASGNTTQVGLLLFNAPLIYFGGLVAHLWRANPVLVLLAPFGIVTAAIQFARGRGSLLILLVALLYAPILGMVAPFVAPAFQNGRYLGAPVAATVLLAVLGGWQVWLMAGRSRGVKNALLVGLVALAGFNMVSTAIANSSNTAQAESSINRMQVAIGEWLNRNTPADAVIACNDVGAIGYFADRRVLDLLGLVTPEVAAFRSKQRVGSENYGALEYLKKKKPDFLAIFPNWFPDLGQAGFLTPVFTADVPDNEASEVDFKPQARSMAAILITGLTVEPVRSLMKVYRCDWTKANPSQQGEAEPR